MWWTRAKGTDFALLGGVASKRLVVQAASGFSIPERIRFGSAIRATRRARHQKGWKAAESPVARGVSRCAAARRGLKKVARAGEIGICGATGGPGGEIRGTMRRARTRRAARSSARNGSDADERGSKGHHNGVLQQGCVKARDVGGVTPVFWPREEKSDTLSGVASKRL